MEHANQFLSASRRRTFGAIFLLVFLMLASFALRAAGGVGGPGLYVVALVQMLLLAAIVAPYVFAVIFLGGEDEH